MKVLVLSLYYKPDLSAGSFRITSLVEKLREQGADVEVVTTLPNRYSSFTSQALEKEVNDGLVIHRISLPPHKSGMVDQIKAFSRYYKAAHKLTKNKNYDIVFASSSRLFTAYLGARIAKQKKVPLYLDIRDIFADTIKDVLSAKLTWLIKPVLSIIERYTFSKAARINLVSEGFKDYFLERFSDRDYRFFTNGIDNEFLDVSFDTKNNLKVNIFGKKGRILTIVYAGNIGEGQGLHSIVPQLSSAIGEKIEFVVIGDGGRKQQLIDKSVGVTNLKVLPPVKRAELIEIYKNADILFLHLNDYPAFEKVLPSKIFEYAALGKPILAGVSGYAASFLQQEVDNAAVFSPGDVEQAVVAIKSLSLGYTDRVDFRRKFARDCIMNKMASDLIAVGRL
ncbi:glycosyltransferase family 4 protein [Pseudidiomarina gelatinasegens]|uniref:glycosyltransferase family 4 protein n=1 Tax=Pseudidiomarina gelatinasegens TaxID=2487740 RepID=UPI0030EE3D7C